MLLTVNRSPTRLFIASMRLPSENHCVPLLFHSGRQDSISESSFGVIDRSSHHRRECPGLKGDEKDEALAAALHRVGRSAVERPPHEVVLSRRPQRLGEGGRLPLDLGAVATRHLALQRVL